MGRFWLQRGWAPAEALYTRLTQDTGDDGSRDDGRVGQTPADTLLPHLRRAAPDRDRERTQQWLDACRPGSAAAEATPSVTLPYLPTAEEFGGGRERGPASAVMPSGADSGGMVELWYVTLLSSTDQLASSASRARLA